jgi:glycosyltransferase involved in cell wall biosynthesis
MYNVAVVLNADGRTISNSETFIRSHIDSLKAEFNVMTLVGNPGQRRLLDERTDFQSLGFWPRAFRKMLRLLRGQTVRQQDNVALAKLFRDRKIHCCFAEYGMSGVGVMDVCMRLGTPLVVHFHGYDAYRHDLFEKYRNDYRKMFSMAARVIAVSKDMKARLEREIGFGEKLVYNSCGFNAAITENQLEYDAPKDPYSVSYVGRLTHKKEPVGLIKAFAPVVKAVPDARLSIIGDGELRTECESAIRELGLQNNVTLLGTKDHRDVLGILSRSSLFIMNSVTAETGDKEGTPVSLMEAMALGNTVIATRHGGIVDIVEHGETGLLYNEFDYDSLSELIISAFTGEINPGIPANARNYATKNLSDAVKNEALRKIVRECIEQANTPGRPKKPGQDKVA